MQGLADGYFILPTTLAHYLASQRLPALDDAHPAVREALASVTARLDALLAVGGQRSAVWFHRQLGSLLWEHCGMERNSGGLTRAIEAIRDLRARFWRELTVPGSGTELNQGLERAGRVADFLELGELMCIDALHRDESCGCHLRSEHQTGDGEALREDEHFAYVAAWQYAGEEGPPILHKEQLAFEYVPLAQRSYR